jgi:hypothetical protein
MDCARRGWPKCGGDVVSRYAQVVPPEPPKSDQK